jgi:hypothetical protein
LVSSTSRSTPAGAAAARTVPAAEVGDEPDPIAGGIGDHYAHPDRWRRAAPRRPRPRSPRSRRASRRRRREAGPRVARPVERLERALGGVDLDPSRRASRSAPSEWSLCSWVRRRPRASRGRPDPAAARLDLAAGEASVDQDPPPADSTTRQLPALPEPRTATRMRGRGAPWWREWEVQAIGPKVRRRSYHTDTAPTRHATGVPIAPPLRERQAAVRGRGARARELPCPRRAAGRAMSAPTRALARS